MLAELTACESEVMSPSERLWRQVPPGLCTDELPVIDAFIPSTKDERKLSVGLSSRISVEDCYHDYTGAMGCRSIGVMQLFVSSVSGAAETTNEKEPLTVRVVDDAECGELTKIEQGAFASRHNALFAASCATGRHVAAGNLDDRAARKALTLAGETLNIPHQDIERAIARGFAKGVERPAPQPNPAKHVDRHETLAELVEWWSRAFNDPKYQSAKGATTRRILAAFFLCATKAGNTHIEESYREIAENAGVSLGTIRNHRKLITPWVTPISVSNKFSTKRSTWQINTRAGMNTPKAPLSGVAGMFKTARTPQRHTLDDPSHDQWIRWSTGWAIWIVLDEHQPTHHTTLADLTGLHPSSIRRILYRLRDLGVAQRDVTGWTRSSSIPCSNDNFTMRETRHKQHQQQRSAHRAWLHHILTRRHNNRHQPPPIFDPETGEKLDTQPTKPRTKLSSPERSTVRRVEQQTRHV